MKHALMSNHQPSPHHGHGIESHGMVPTGWKRDLINGRIVYITPSNCALWSLDQVVGYLLSDGTCKCGLDCPLVIHQVFNFDPCTCLTHSQPATFDTFNSNPTLCNHKRKVASIQNYQSELHQKNQAAELEQMYQRNQRMLQDGIHREGIRQDRMLQEGMLQEGTFQDGTFQDRTLQNTMLQDRILPDGTVTTAMIQQSNVPPSHPVIQQPQSVHYSLIVPSQQATTILMSSHPQEQQQMILSPHHGQLMSPASFGTIGHHPHQINHGHPQLNHSHPQMSHENHVHDNLVHENDVHDNRVHDNHVHDNHVHDNHVHGQQHPPVHDQQLPPSMISGPVFVKQKKGVRKRNKMKTVAAMLKMKS